MGYFVPAHMQRNEQIVVNSRFIATASKVLTVDAVKTILSQIRTEMPDASHHVYAFRIGHGSSVIEGMSDDGEPSGTAGPPVLAVLRGSGIGDILIVVTRYFGGTKLGTGGLVRAYSDTTRNLLAQLVVEEKIERRVLGFDISYALLELVRRLVSHHHGDIIDETFASDVTIIARFALPDSAEFRQGLLELTAGRVEAIDLTT